MRTVSFVAPTSILRKASAFFAQAELDRPQKWCLTPTRADYGGRADLQKTADCPLNAMSTRPGRLTPLDCLHELGGYGALS